MGDKAPTKPRREFICDREIWRATGPIRPVPGKGSWIKPAGGSACALAGAEWPSIAYAVARTDCLISRSRAEFARPFATISAILLGATRSEEHTSELQSLMRISYAVFCLKKKK